MAAAPRGNLPVPLPPLLSLPSELILEIIAYLPLAAHLIFRLQVCRALRNTTPSEPHTEGIFESTSSSNSTRHGSDPTSRGKGLHLGPLRLNPPHRFSLAEWLTARREFQRLALARLEEQGNESLSLEGCCTNIENQLTPSISVETFRSSSPFDWHPSTATSSTTTTSSWSHNRSPSHSSHPSKEAEVRNLSQPRSKVGVEDRRDAGPAHEARMLRRILGFLRLIQPEDALPPEWTVRPWEAISGGAVCSLERSLAPWHDERVERKSQGRAQLRSLSLIGWSGIDGNEVVRIISANPAFREVKLVVKTDRLDSGAWDHLYSGQSSPPQQPQRYAPTAVEASGARRFRSPPRLPNELSPPPASIAFETAATRIPQAPRLPYIETQVLVNVGSRLPKGSSIQIKGKGLSAGYRALCFSPSSPSSHPTLLTQTIQHSHPTQPTPRKEQEQQQVEQQEGNQAVQTPLHIIFQGRFHLEESGEIEQMLESSHVRCGTCKEVLLF